MNETITSQDAAAAFARANAWEDRIVHRTEGFALTYALWRSAALTRPDVVRPPAWWTYPAKLLGIVAALFLLHYVIEPQTPAYPLAITGGLWLALALISTRWSRLGRTTALGIGVVIILGAFALPYLAVGMDARMLDAALIGGLAPLVGGFSQTIRG